MNAGRIPMENQPAKKQRFKTSSPRPARARRGAYRRDAPADQKPVVCPYRDKAAVLVSGAVLFPHRPTLRAFRFWRCFTCDAHVECHPPADSESGGIGDGTVPKGTLANAPLRRARRAAHSALDPMWQSGAMTRMEAYAWIARELGILYRDTHIGLFSLDECERVVALVNARPDAKKFARHSDSCHR